MILLRLQVQLKILPHFLHGADCGVLSSVSEGLPVSLLEYGMAGLPVIVTDVGQCAEVVGNGRFGRVVPPGKPNSDGKGIIMDYPKQSTSKTNGGFF